MAGSKRKHLETVEEEDNETEKWNGKRSSVKHYFGCDHENLQADSSTQYFTVEYMNKSKNWPKECIRCNKGFTTKPKGKCDMYKEYKVGGKTPVWCCARALVADCKCVYAFCAPCYTKTTDEDEELRKQQLADGSPRSKRVEKQSKKPRVSRTKRNLLLGEDWVTE